MQNQEIRRKAAANGVRMWEIADKFHVTESTLCRWMRKELDGEKKKQALLFVDEIARERRKEA